MDPEATLRMAEDLMHNQPQEALEALDDYWKWRHAGGFMPDDGDNRARAISAVARRGRRKIHA